MGRSCPSGCPEDLDGNSIVDDADLLIVLFNSGAQGAPAFAGQVQSPQGAFTVSLTLRLGDWVGSAQPVKVQLKPVGRETDANTPIYEWTFSVSGTDTAVQLTNLPAGVHTVRAFPASPGRWLRTEGKLLTEVPWLFAAPTGANKVTVYWDGVPGATGYRVRWGATSGSYPNSSAVLPATARQHTVLGLVSEREYYFVVEAEYNGLWGPPSEEDSAVPHEGAIPWDTGEAGVIMSSIRRLTNSTTDDDLLIIDVISPDGLIYTDSGNVQQPTSFFDSDRSLIDRLGTDDDIPVTQAVELQNTCTGPYRLVKSSQGFVGAQGSFFAPSAWGPRYPYQQISIPPQVDRRGGTWDTPYIYFGFSSGRVNVEGGIMYHRAGRGGISYGRWQAYIIIADGRPKAQQPVLEDTANQRGHIIDNDLTGGTEVFLQLIAYPKTRYVHLRVIPKDPYFGDLFHREIGGSAKVLRSFSNVTFRRVFSIAQTNVPCLFGGYVRTGSFISMVGIGYNPVEGSLIEPPMQLTQQPPPLNVWFEWTAQRTILHGSYPSPSSGIVSWVHIVPFSREIGAINLR